MALLAKICWSLLPFYDLSSHAGTMGSVRLPDRTIACVVGNATWGVLLDFGSVLARAVVVCAARRSSLRLRRRDYEPLRARTAARALNLLQGCCRRCILELAHMQAPKGRFPESDGQACAYASSQDLSLHAAAASRVRGRKSASIGRSVRACRESNVCRCSEMNRWARASWVLGFVSMPA